MRFVNPIPFVRDITVSKAFYRDILGLTVTVEHDNFVQFQGNFAIHDGTALAQMVWEGSGGEAPDTYGLRNLLLYFEDDDIDARFDALKDQVELIHGLERQAWGQRVFRFYDPDGHAIEIGEPMS
ncbi:VOC family protein [Bauldia sp.]|uniref:VOC family protein n=1 Tax=Bauldia sp. TaxID=2575872 RepID=UPI003BA8A612